MSDLIIRDEQQTVTVAMFHLFDRVDNHQELLATAHVLLENNNLVICQVVTPTGKDYHTSYPLIGSVDFKALADNVHREIRQHESSFDMVDPVSRLYELVTSLTVQYLSMRGAVGN